MARVAVFAGWPWSARLEGFEAVAETWSTCGEARLMATLFPFRDAAEVERAEDRVVLQALADSLAWLIGQSAYAQGGDTAA